MVNGESVTMMTDNKITEESLEPFLKMVRESSVTSDELFSLLYELTVIMNRTFRINVVKEVYNKPDIYVSSDLINNEQIKNQQLKEILAILLLSTWQDYENHCENVSKRALEYAEQQAKIQTSNHSEKIKQFFGEFVK
jgi:hypothetical protein